MYDDYDYETEDTFGLPAELSYEFASNEVLTKLKKKWNSLKDKLQKQEDASKEINEFDELINYFIL